MLLVHDVLDKQLTDRHGVRMGKADGLVMLQEGDGPPRVVSIEVGSLTLARRLGRRLGRWATALARHGGGKHTESYRIPWTLVRGITLEIAVDVDAEATRVNVVEDWLRVHVVEHLPGGRP